MSKVKSEGHAKHRHGVRLEIGPHASFHVKVWSNGGKGAVMLCTAHATAQHGGCGGGTQANLGWNIVATADEALEIARALLEVRAQMLSMPDEELSNSFPDEDLGYL